MSHSAPADPAFELARPDLSPWRAGNTGTEGVWQFDALQPGRTVMVSALVHGNELCGAWAVAGLLASGLRPQAGRLVLVLANLAAFDRFDAARPDDARFVDEDLNRQWAPARLVDGALATCSSQERRRAAQLAPFVAQADWLLDLHSMHQPGAPLMLTGLQPRNLALARALRNPQHTVLDAGHQDGVRMRDCGRFGLADAQAPETRSLLVECGYHGAASSRVVAQDLCARFLVEAGCLSAAEATQRLPGWRQPDGPTQWALDVTGPVVARSANFCFTRPFQGLDVIPKAGSVIGDNDGEPVTTPYDACVLVMPSIKQARAGVTVVRFARRRLL